jgi:hypothetical protein
MRLLTRQSQSKACAILALFPAEERQKLDIVDVGDDGRVRQIVSKPAHTVFAIADVSPWGRRSHSILHEYVAAYTSGASLGSTKSLKHGPFAGNSFANCRSYVVVLAHTPEQGIGFGRVRCERFHVC